MFSLRRALRLIAVFLISVILVSTVILATLHPGGSGKEYVGSTLRGFVLTEQQLLRWLETSPESPYGLFFGPSTTLFGISPRIVDDQMKFRGVEIRTYNFGLVGACSHETDYYLRRLLGRIEAQESHLPDWVVIDLTLPGTFGQLADDEANQNRILSKRSEEWHDLYQLRAVSRTLIRDAETPLDLKIKSIGLHIRVGLKRMAGRTFRGRPPILGLAHQWGEDFPEKFTPQGFIESEDEDRGYAPTSGEAIDRVREEFLTGLPDVYAGMLSEKTREFSVPPRDITSCNHEAVSEQAGYLEQRSIDAVYIVSPILLNTQHAHSLNAAGLLPRFLSYDNPVEFPDYYSVESRHEKFHLAPDAAGRFSRRLADDLMDMLYPEAGRPDDLRAAF